MVLLTIQTWINEKVSKNNLNLHVILVLLLTLYTLICFNPGKDIKVGKRSSFHKDTYTRRVFFTRDKKKLLIKNRLDKK